MSMDTSVNIYLGTFMVDIIEEIKQRNTTHFTGDSNGDVLVCYVLSFQLLEKALSLLFYLLMITNLYISSVMGEWTQIKFAELINVYLCQRSLRLIDRPQVFPFLHLVIHLTIIENLFCDLFFFFFFSLWVSRRPRKTSSEQYSPVGKLEFSQNMPTGSTHPISLGTHSASDMGSFVKHTRHIWYLNECHWILKNCIHLIIMVKYTIEHTRA